MRGIAETVPPPQSKLFYGWVIVLVSFSAHFIATGAGFYSFSVFFKTLVDEFGWKREEISYASTIALTVGAVWAPMLGRLVDKFGARAFMVGGSLLAGLAFVLMSGIHSIMQYYLLFGVMLAVGNSAMGGIPANWCIASWFVRRRGLAMGIATMGVSFSGVIMPPLAYLFLEKYGWRMSFIGLGFLTWIVVFPLAFLFMKRSPEDMGLTPDGDNPDDAGIKELHNEPAIKAITALKMPSFWKIELAFGMAYMPLGTMLIHQVAFLTDIGISNRMAAIILAICAGSGTLGKLVSGFAMDIMDKRVAIIASFVTQGLGIALMLNASTMTGAVLFAFTFGFGMGGLVPLHQATLGHYFGRKSFGTIAGIGAPIITMLQAFGQPFAGWIFDTRGNYDIAFIAFIGSLVIATIIISTLNPSLKE